MQSASEPSLEQPARASLSPCGHTPSMAPQMPRLGPKQSVLLTEQVKYKLRYAFSVLAHLLRRSCWTLQPCLCALVDCLYTASAASRLMRGPSRCGWLGAQGHGQLAQGAEWKTLCKAQSVMIILSLRLCHDHGLRFMPLGMRHEQCFCFEHVLRSCLVLAKAFTLTLRPALLSSANRVGVVIGIRA